MNLIDLLEEMGIHPKKVASRNGGEYHSNCPDCGGTDRFCIWPKQGNNGRYWCRRCLRSGDLIQFCRDFQGMDYKSACAKVGKQLTNTHLKRKFSHNESFVPQILSIPSDIWIQKAIEFIAKSHQCLLSTPSLINQDKDRGMVKQSIIDFQLGWNPCEFFEPRESWGLQDQSADGGSRFICLPKGIVIPSFREVTPIKIKIRRNSWKPEDEYPKYHVVSGGMSSPSLYGNVKNPIVLVEAELDAILIQQYAADICCCIALGGVTFKPDYFIDQLLRKAPCVLFALDFDDAGKKAFIFWRSTYQNLKAYPVPRGKSPGDAYTLGVDLRAWVQSGIRSFGTTTGI